MQFKIPHPLQVEHEQLHDVLRKATAEAGELGAAAKRLAQLLHPHFVKEEAYALPPLGLLADLARGRVTPEMREVLAMTDRLNAELDQMLAEHKENVTALDAFAAVAKQQGRNEYVEFAQALALHAQYEEEVSYPTAILVGEYVRAKLS
jgi:hypothetical protein